MREVQDGAVLFGDVPEDALEEGGAQSSVQASKIAGAALAATYTTKNYLILTRYSRTNKKGIATTRGVTRM